MSQTYVTKSHNNIKIVLSSEGVQFSYFEMPLMLLLYINQQNEHKKYFNIKTPPTCFGLHWPIIRDTAEQRQSSPMCRYICFVQPR